MTEGSARNFRIYLDLHSFFEDHRRAAVIFVTKNIKTILDLQNRIAFIFQIEGFYLCLEDRFLPPSEDVRVLESDQTIRVMRDSTQTTAIPKKKKHKEKNNIAYETTLNRKHTLSPKHSHDEIEAPNKRLKKIAPNCDSTVDNKGLFEPTIPKKSSKKEEINQSKDKEASPKRETMKINTLLPVLQTHINGCNKTGRSKTYDFVRLSHHSDTPICSSLSQPVPTITDKYLEKKTVNIVKIDIIKKGDVSLSVNETQVPESPVSEVNGFHTPINYVKTVVRSIEERNSPKDKESSENWSEPVKSENSFAQQADQETLVTDKALSQVDSDDLNVKEEEMLESVKKEDQLMTAHVSPESSSVTNFSSVSPSNGTVNTNHSQVSPNNFFYTQRKLSGLGALLGSLVESDSIASADSNPDDQFVTKRVRKRVRKHKKKSKSSDSIFVPPEPLISEPLKTQACPKMHIKFSDEGDAQFEPRRESVVVVSDEDSSAVFVGDEFMFRDDNIQKAPLMTDMKPKVGDIVGFKILKLSESYTPQISGNIVGKIEELQNEKAKFRILRGIEQCSLPVGKLSLIPDDDSQLKATDVQELDWSQVIEPRLIFP